MKKKTGLVFKNELISFFEESPIRLYNSELRSSKPKKIIEDEQSTT